MGFEGIWVFRAYIYFRGLGDRGWGGKVWQNAFKNLNWAGSGYGDHDVPGTAVPP